MNLRSGPSSTNLSDFAAALYDLELKLIDGQTLSLNDHRESVMLVVNTASKCGFTPQYRGLESLHRKYSSRGLLVIACPCNQFGEQEPGGETEIQEFCEFTYQVQFPMTEKLRVNGAKTHPLFVLLKSQAPGLLNSTKIKWNFTKFLISRHAESVQRFSPLTSPKRIELQLRKLFANP